MKLVTALFAATMLAGCSQQPGTADANQAASAEDMPMSGTKDLPMQSETGPMAATASASGTVENIDAASGTVTIAHGPVASLHWPAMKMGFKATPAQLASVQTGQQVDFEFESKGRDATITRISPAAR